MTVYNVVMPSSLKIAGSLLGLAAISVLSSCNELMPSQEVEGSSEFVVHTISGTESPVSQIALAELDGQICYLDEDTGWMRRLDGGQEVLQVPETILKEREVLMDALKIVQVNESVYAWRLLDDFIYVQVDGEWKEIGLNGRILSYAHSGSNLALGVAWHRPELFTEDVYEAILLEGGNVVSKTIINSSVSGSGSIWYVEEGGSLVATVRGEKVEVIDDLPSMLGIEYYVNIVCANEEWCAVAWTSERTGLRERELAFVSIEGEILKAEGLAAILTLEILNHSGWLSGADTSGLWMLARVGDDLKLLTFRNGDLETILLPDSGWRFHGADYNGRRLALVESTFSDGDTDDVSHTTRLTEYAIDSVNGGVKVLTEETVPGSLMVSRHRLLIHGDDAYVVVHSDPFPRGAWTSSLLRIPLSQGE